MVLVIIYGGNIKQSYTHVGSPELRAPAGHNKNKGNKREKAEGADGGHLLNIDF